MTRARNLSGLSTVTGQPTTTTPVNLGPLGVGTFARIYGTWESDQINTVAVAATNLQVSGITTGLNVSGIITAQNGLNVNGNIVNGLNVSAGIATFAGAIDANSNVDIAGNLTVAGSLTYEDLTDIDSIGVGTFRKGIIVAGVGTFSSGVGIADSIFHIGDENTQIRFPAADTITAETSGTERLRITSGGDIVTQAMTAVSFNNDGSNTQIYEFTGDGTAGNYGVLNISGNQNTNNTSTGILKFINKENSNSSSGGNAGSRQVASIAAYAVTSDSNAGDDSGGYLQFATKPEAGGVAEAMRIDSSGRLLLGTTTEGQADADNLTIADSGSCGITLRSGTSAAGAIYFSDATSGAAEYDGAVLYNHSSQYMAFYANESEKVRITSAGELLLGATTSAIVGGGGASLYQIETTSQNSISCVAHRGTGNASGSILILGKSRGTSAGAVTAVAANDELGALRFAGADGTDLQSRGGEVSCEVDGTPGSNDIPGRLLFKTTADGAASPTERLRITSGGKVNIGGDYTQTTRQLGVVSSAEQVASFEYNGADADGSEVRFYHNSASPADDDTLAYLQFSGKNSADEVTLYSAILAESSDVTNGTEDGNIIFSTRSDGTFGERFRLNANGYAEFAGASDLRLTLGSQGTAGTNDANWIRASGADLMFNAASGNTVWEAGGTGTMNLSSAGILGLGVYRQNPGCVAGIEMGTATGNVGLSWGGVSYNYSNIWTEYGSGDIFIAGGLRGNGTSSGFVSSYSGAVARAAIQVDAFGASGIHFYTSTAQTITKDAAIVVDERMRVRENGLVAIGSPGELGNGHSGCLQVINTSSTGQTNDCLTYFETAAADWIIKTNYNKSGNHYHMRFDEEGTLRGEIKGTDGSNVAFTPGSDYRWKENVVDLTGTEGINFCKNLKPRKYNWIDNRKNTGKINTVNGFIAHEVEEAGIGHLVYGNGKDAVNEDGSIDGQTLDYAGMTPVLAAAIKGLIAKVETLEAEVAALKSS